MKTSAILPIAVACLFACCGGSRKPHPDTPNKTIAANGDWCAWVKKGPLSGRTGLECNTDNYYLEYGYGPKSDPITGTLAACFPNTVQDAVKDSILIDRKPLKTTYTEAFTFKLKSELDGSVDFSALGGWAEKWLPKGAVKTASNVSIEVKVSLSELEVDTVSKITTAFMKHSAALEDGVERKVYDLCIEQLCEPGVVFTSRVYRGVLNIDLKTATGSDLSFDASVADVASVKASKTSGSKQHIVLGSKFPVPIAVTTAPVKTHAARLCIKPQSARALPKGTKTLKIAKMFSQGMMENFGCLVLEIGADVANKMCANNICSKNEIKRAYRTSMATLLSTTGKALCSSVKDRVENISRLTVNCPSVLQFLLNLSDVAGANSLEVFHENPQYLVKIVDMFLSSSKKRRGLTREFARGWTATAHHGESFTRAKLLFEELRGTCANQGCTIPELEIKNTGSADSWATAQGALFGLWIAYFKSKSHPISCSGMVMQRSPQGTWASLLTRGGSQDPNSFKWKPPRGGKGLSEDFASFVFPSEL